MSYQPLSKQEIDTIGAQVKTVCSEIADKYISYGFPEELRDVFMAICAEGVAFGSHYMKDIATGEKPWIPPSPTR